MEASSLSDADLLIVTDNTSKGSEELKEAIESIWIILDKLNIDRPKDGGVFGKPSTEEEICGKNIGNGNEQLNVYGKRLLFLLESQPLYNEQNYDTLVRNIVDRYAKGYVSDEPTKEWAFLLNDLLRYFRSLCVNYQWDFVNDNVKWPIRNIKLRHSRLIMYGGLLLTLGEASKERVNKVDNLLNSLHLTPLERIAKVYSSNRDWNFDRVAGLYNVFLSKINQEEVRDSLKNSKYKSRYNNEPIYADLKANSDALVAELLRFVMARHNNASWSERFFEYMLF